MRVRRLTIHGPRLAGLEDLEIPDEPLAPAEVLVRTRYSLISPGTELAYYAGDQTLGHQAEPYPFYPGYAAVGEVLATGDAAPVRQGDLVLAHTPHQTVARFDSRSTVCVPLPRGLAPDVAPLARLAQVSAVSVRLMAARPGDRAAVTGLGLVGNLAAQLLRCAGLRVLGVEPLLERRALAQRCGIAETIDPVVLQDGTDESEGLLNSCAVVIECSGQDRGVLSALSLAAQHGEVFLVGAAWKRRTEVVAADVARPVFNKYLALRSGWEWQIPRYGVGPSGSIARCTTWALDCLHDGSLHATGLITDRVPPEAAPDAYAHLLDHPDRHLGVLIEWSL
ncbi:MAG TPA: zinc-binding alcohol dehydrogenase [Chloroflexota bacterium]|nr:zinc-binding alcohol dehydrogenase [Chloroflexota bacterium]